MTSRLTIWIESRWFQYGIIGIICANAITLGLETAPQLVGQYMPALKLLDFVFLLIFTFELGIKLLAYRQKYFWSGWNIFDFIIVTISWLPFIESLAVLRSLRILRVLRLVSVVPQFRKVVQAFFDSLSGLAVIGTILALIFYVGAVMATKLFSADFPDFFGTIGRSLYSLFQIMTLESWSMGIVRPVMEVYPLAWLFFVPFILLTTFAALNLLIGVVVNSMQTLHENTTDTLDSHMHKQDQDRNVLKEQLNQLTKQLEDINRRL